VNFDARQTAGTMIVEWILLIESSIQYENSDRYTPFVMLRLICRCLTRVKIINVQYLNQIGHVDLQDLANPTLA